MLNITTHKSFIKLTCNICELADFSKSKFHKFLTKFQIFTFNIIYSNKLPEVHVITNYKIRDVFKNILKLNKILDISIYPRLNLIFKSKSFC